MYYRLLPGIKCSGSVGLKASLAVCKWRITLGVRSLAWRRNGNRPACQGGRQYGSCQSRPVTDIREITKFTDKKLVKILDK